MLGSIEDFLTASEEQQIIDAIRQAESNTSGEIRVHLEGHCDQDPMKRAMEVFNILRMDNTRLQNGVLIYVAVHDHSFTICGDEGIDKVVSSGFWDKTRDIIEHRFKEQLFAQGLAEGIVQVGQQLKAHFPILPGDQNELSDSISTS